MEDAVFELFRSLFDRAFCAVASDIDVYSGQIFKIAMDR